MQYTSINAAGSLINLLAANANNPTLPVVGMGATIIGYTDRNPATVIEVSARKIVVQMDDATRTDKNGMSESQSYEFAANPNGAKRVYTLRKNGQWIAEGDSIKNGGRIQLGHRSKYYDFSF